MTSLQFNAPIDSEANVRSSLRLYTPQRNQMVLHRFRDSGIRNSRIYVLFLKYVKIMKKIDDFNMHNAL